MRGLSAICSGSQTHPKPHPIGKNISRSVPEADTRTISGAMPELTSFIIDFIPEPKVGRQGEFFPYLDTGKHRRNEEGRKTSPHEKKDRTPGNYTTDTFHHHRPSIISDSMHHGPVTIGSVYLATNHGQT
jgi:hypothetical protein